MREAPDHAIASWERVLSESALGAVAASRSLHQSLARWQADLVREALDGGASWEDIGEALGTTRQAAWARFRHALAADKGGDVTEREQVRQRLSDLWNSGQAHLREMETRWQEEHDRLREQVHESHEGLNEAKRRHARERQAARQELRRSMAALKAGRG